MAQVTGCESHTARGKLHLFHSSTPLDSPYYHELLGKCLQCRACDQACPRQLEPSKQILARRSQQGPGQEQASFSKMVARQLLVHPRLAQAGSATLHLINKVLPAESGLHQRLTQLIPAPPPAKLPRPSPPTTGETITFFPGCLATFLQNDIYQACQLLAQSCNLQLHAPANLSCCGLAAQASGKLTQARELAWQNIQALANSSGPILTSCASCYSQLRSYSSLFRPGSQEEALASQVSQRLQEFSTFFASQHLKLNPVAQAIYYHQPCHLRHGSDSNSNSAYGLIQQASSKPTPTLPDQQLCCGHGGLFQLANPQLSTTIGQRLHDKVWNLEPELVVTSCSGCLLQWQQLLINQKTDLQAYHLAVFLAQRLRC